MAEEHDIEIAIENDINLPNVVHKEATQPNPAFISTGLEDYLRKTTEGKTILKAYKKCSSQGLPFPKNIRSKLVRLVIKREKDWALRNIPPEEVLQKFVISTQRFLILANEIAHIFPLENPATYFTPFKQVKKRSILTSGKLWHHYNYTKDRMKIDSILESHKKEAETIVFSKEEHQQIEWLSSNIHPWSQVVEYWQSSFRARYTLYVENEDLPVSDYVAQFPCLSVQEAKELFALDFKQMFKNKAIVGENDWTIIKRLLILELSRVNIKDPIELGYINCLKSRDLSADKEDFLIFYLLCHLLPTKRDGKRKADGELARIHKLTLEERRESFILQVETDGNIEKKLADFKSTLKTNNITFQPNIIAVGTIPNIEKYLVAVEDILYEIDTAMNAVTLALHIFFALDCKYPENTANIWTFLQRILLDMDLEDDVTTIQMNILLGAIRSALEEQHQMNES